DAVIGALALDATGQVPWWPPERREVTLHRILVHMIAETDRPPGQADIVRELIDGAAGVRQDNGSLAPGDRAWWATYRTRLEVAAREAGAREWAAGPDRLLEPVVGVGLIVERRDLAVASRPVQADRFVQGVVGFQLDGADAVGRGLGLQFGQQPASQSQPADLVGDPHALEMSRRVRVELEHPAPDRLGVQGSEQEQSRGRRHLLV